MSVAAKTKPFEYPEIPAHRRERMLKIWAGAQPMHEILTALHFLDCHMRPGALDAALGWLVQNRLTGFAFLDFFRSECAGSHLELQRNLTMRIEKEREQRALYAGRDVL